MAGLGIDVAITGVQQLNGMRALLQPDTVRKAQKGGIAYAAKAAKVAAAKAIGSRYNIKAARIKADIKGPTLYADRAVLRFSRRPPTLAQYGFNPGTRGGAQPGLGRGLGWGAPKPKGKPASAKIFRTGQRVKYKGVFLINGGVPVRQVGEKLVTEYGPSIGSMFAGKSRYGDEIRSTVQSRINEQFIVGMQRALDSAARGYGK